MTEQFTYSILKYQHSQLLGESLNVGVLFSFDQDAKLYFVAGNPQRVKAVYPEFDANIFQSIAKSIKYKVAQSAKIELFRNKYILKDYINTILLPEDSSALQFSEIYAAVNSLGSNQRAVDEFARLLLPSVETKKEEVKHNEGFILKKFTDSIIKRNITIDHRMRRDYPIKIKGVHLNFDLSWKNGIVHLVKPISFDLKEEREILQKSVTFFGYLDLLKDHAKKHDLKFDLLVAGPQDNKLQSVYDDALYNLSRSPAPKEIVTEEKLEEYSEETAKILHAKDLE